MTQFKLPTPGMPKGAGKEPPRTAEGALAEPAMMVMSPTNFPSAPASPGTQAGGGSPTLEELERQLLAHVNAPTQRSPALPRGALLQQPQAQRGTIQASSPQAAGVADVGQAQTSERFAALMEDHTAPQQAHVDTGVRMQESTDEQSDTVLLPMPRGSPAEICVRIAPGDRVLGIEAPETPAIGDVMRLALEGAKGPAKVEFIYTSSLLLQKAEETLDSVDAVSAHVRQSGDGRGLILCTAVEHNVRALLRKEYSIQQELRGVMESGTDGGERVASLEQSVLALRRHVKAQQEVIDNYQRSLAFYEQADKSPVPDKSPASQETPDKSPHEEPKNSALILAQEKEILALQRELLQRNEELQEMRNTWTPPDRWEQLTTEHARLKDAEKIAEIAKSEGEALFRRTRKLDQEADALRSMVRALGEQLLVAKRGLVNDETGSGSVGKLPMDQYNRAVEKMKQLTVQDSSFSMDAYRLQATLAERDDLATKIDELQDQTNKQALVIENNKESLMSRDKAIADLEEQLANFQALYEETVNEMQAEVQKTVQDAGEVKRQLVEAHETAMKELQTYVSELETASSAEQSTLALQHKAVLEAERKANEDLRHELRKAELQIQEGRKDAEDSVTKAISEHELTKNELMAMAEKSANQRVHLVELERLLDEARKENRKLNTAMQHAAQEATEKINFETDLMHKSLAERETKYVVGMRELSEALHDTRVQLKEQIGQKAELSQQVQELKVGMEQKSTEIENLTAEVSVLGKRLQAAVVEEDLVRDGCEKLARENAVLKAGMQEARAGLKMVESEETNLREVCRRLEGENKKLQHALEQANAGEGAWQQKEARQEERMQQQQRHNEELLELLEQQQSTLVRNSKDLADYEKTLVQMAAELDRFRQNDVQSLTPGKVEPRPDFVSPRLSKRTPSPVLNANRDRLDALKTQVNASTLSPAINTSRAQGSAMTPPSKVVESGTAESMLIASSLGLVLKFDSGRAWVESCPAGGPAAQCLIIDVGDEVLAVNGKDVVGSTAPQILEHLEPLNKFESLVTIFLAKRDMPARRCRVVLKRAGDTPLKTPQQQQ